MSAEQQTHEPEPTTAEVDVQFDKNFGFLDQKHDWDKDIWDAILADQQAEAENAASVDAATYENPAETYKDLSIAVASPEVVTPSEEPLLEAGKLELLLEPTYTDTIELPSPKPTTNTRSVSVLNDELFAKPDKGSHRSDYELPRPEEIIAARAKAAEASQVASETVEVAPANVEVGYLPATGPIDLATNIGILTGPNQVIKTDSIPVPTTVNPELIDKDADDGLEIENVDTTSAPIPVYKNEAAPQPTTEAATYRARGRHANDLHEAAPTDEALNTPEAQEAREADFNEFKEAAQALVEARKSALAANEPAPAEDFTKLEELYYRCIANGQDESALQTITELVKDAFEIADIAQSRGEHDEENEAIAEPVAPEAAASELQAFKQAKDILISKRAKDITAETHSELEDLYAAALKSGANATELDAINDQVKEIFSKAERSNERRIARRDAFKAIFRPSTYIERDENGTLYNPLIVVAAKAPAALRRRSERYAERVAALPESEREKQGANAFTMAAIGGIVMAGLGAAKAFDKSGTFDHVLGNVADTLDHFVPQQHHVEAAQHVTDTLGARHSAAGNLLDTQPKAPATHAPEVVAAPAAPEAPSIDTLANAHEIVAGPADTGDGMIEKFNAAFNLHIPETSWNDLAPTLPKGTVYAPGTGIVDNNGVPTYGWDHVGPVSKDVKLAVLQFAETHGMK